MLWFYVVILFADVQVFASWGVGEFEAKGDLLVLVYCAGIALGRNESVRSAEVVWASQHLGGGVCHGLPRRAAMV